jgi:quinol monooxygenase YgiN
MPIDVIALLTPKAGKADRVHPPIHSPCHTPLSNRFSQVQELLTTAAAAVKEHEPGTLRYHVQRETKGDAPVFVMLETWVLDSFAFFFCFFRVRNIREEGGRGGVASRWEEKCWCSDDRYKDSAAIAAHGKTEYFKTMGRTMKKEDLLAEPMRILVTKEVGG